MYHGNGWGTVCDDGFDDVDADVICRSLGFWTGEARTDAFFGEGTGDVVVRGLACTGDEASLYECQHRNQGDTWRCSHSEDAGVVCKNGIHLCIFF